MERVKGIEPSFLIHPLDRPRMGVHKDRIWRWLRACCLNLVWPRLGKHSDAAELRVHRLQALSRYEFSVAGQLPRPETSRSNSELLAQAGPREKQAHQTRERPAAPPIQYSQTRMMGWLSGAYTTVEDPEQRPKNDPDRSLGLRGGGNHPRPILGNGFVPTMGEEMQINLASPCSRRSTIWRAQGHGFATAQMDLLATSHQNMTMY